MTIRQINKNKVYKKVPKRNNHQDGLQMNKFYMKIS